MAQTYYCPHCGTPVKYEIVKPTTCPRCERRFADAFKVTVAKVDPPPAPIVEDDDDEPRLTRSALEARRKSLATTTVKPRARRGGADDPEASANLMTPVGSKTRRTPSPPEEAEDEVDDYNPREARRLARELAASIDPATIVIEDDDDSVVSFGQLVEEGKRRGGASKAKAKRRR